MADLNGLLEHLIEHCGSDLHVKAGSAPHLRVHGRLRRTPFDTSSVEDVAEMVADVVPTSRARDLAERGEVSLAYAVPGLGRFRLNVYRQRGTYGLSVRLVAPGASDLASLHLPVGVQQLAELSSGLVIVSGPSSSGKSTTVAAMLDHINRTRAVHIVTLEDPIEVLLADRSSMVSQREIGVDVRGAAEAMRRINHLDPDVIAVSDLPDADTISEALTAAGSGRLVVVTSPAPSVASTIHLLVGQFELPRQPRIRHGLAAVLRGVMSQRLVDTAEGSDRVPAVELLTASPEVAGALIDGADEAGLVSVMERGGALGMASLEQALAGLVRDGKVNAATALAEANDPDRLAALLAKL